MDDVQQNFERGVADRFFDWLSSTGGPVFEFSRRAGDAPDLVYSCGQNELSVEITAAYCDSDHAKFLWEYARGVSNPPVGWFGVGNPDKALIRAVLDRVSAKCNKDYGGLTLLLIEIPPGHTSAENLTELLAKSVFPEVIPYVGIYVTGRFPMTSTSTGGYRVLPIKALPAGAFFSGSYARHSWCSPGPIRSCAIHKRREEANKRLKCNRKTVCGFWPSGETGAGSIPAGHSGEMLQPAESPNSVLETSAGVKLSKEVVMGAGNQIQMTKTTVSLTGRINLKIGIVVAAVAGCLLAVPLTRDYKTS